MIYPLNLRILSPGIFPAIGPSKPRGPAVPIEPDDHTHGGESPQQNLKDYTSAPRIQIGVYWSLQDEPSEQHGER